MQTKRMLVAAAAAALVTNGAARADVFVVADITKTKTVTVTETIDVFKDIDLNVFQWIAVDAVAETDVVKNQFNTQNFVEDENGDGLATIDGSATTASGIVLINQAPGFANNQGNEVSVVHATSQNDGGTFRPRPAAEAKATPTEPEPSSVSYSNWPSNASVEEFVEVDGGVFVHAQSDVEQFNAPTDDGSDGVATLTDAANVFVNVDPATYTNEIITGSFDGATGYAGVNQAAGHLNNQNNALAVAIGDESVYALGESDLGQFNTKNFVDVVDQVRTDSVSASFNGATGVFAVNQSSGSLNNQANVVSIAVGLNVPTAPFAP
jgi:hypothetical protein